MTDWRSPKYGYDDPRQGWYKLRESRGGRWVPVYRFFGERADPDRPDLATYEWQALRDGKPWDVGENWMFLRPIGEIEYTRLLKERPMEMQVKVDFVNGPKQAGGKYGSLKCGDKYISIPIAEQSKFAKGQTYNIEVETKESNGKTFYNWKRTIQQSTPSTERPASGYGSDTQAREIFVTGIIGRYLGGPGSTGKSFPSAEQVEQMIRAAELGWKLAHYNAQEGELDDEIPF